MPRSAPVVLAGLAMGLLSAPSSPAQDVSYRNLVEPVLSSSETAVGETIVYPTGAPARITAVIVTVPPGGETGWHVHPVPVFGYVLEGELSSITARADGGPTAPARAFWTRWRRATTA